jgi:hypothetical protein
MLWPNHCFKWEAAEKVWWETMRVLLYYKILMLTPNYFWCNLQPFQQTYAQDMAVNAKNATNQG